MALNIQKNSAAAKDSLSSTLYGNPSSFELPSHPLNQHGQTTGRLIGGNLSIVFSMLATPERYDFSDAILFIEDLAEHLYHIDRMMHALRKHGALDKIKGLIVGGMTDLEDTDVPFGMTLEELLLSHFQYRKLPVCFDFPAGHIDDNRALILGAEVLLEINENQCLLSYL
jgi:muramoyltetrapeptide carboxypeptidase